MVGQLSFSIIPLILAFDFGLIFWVFLIFWGPNVLFSGSEYSSRTVFGSTHTVKQLLFSIVPSILTLDFDLILGSF